MKSIKPRSCLTDNAFTTIYFHIVHDFYDEGTKEKQTSW